MSIALRDEATGAAAQTRTSAVVQILVGLVAAYAFLLPYQIELAPEFRFAPADVCLLLAFVLACAELRYVPAVWSGWHVALVLIFVIATFIPALQSGDLSRYVLLNKNIGLLLLLFSYLVITSAVTDWEQLRRVLRAFVLSVVCQNVVAMGAFGVGYALGVETPWTSYGGQRLSGLMVDANAYAGLLVLTLTLVEGATSGPQPLLGAWMAGFARVSLICGILLTFSRTAWISLAGVVLLLWIVRPETIARTLLATCAALTAALLAAGQGFVSFVGAMASRPELVRGRFELVELALAQFARHPFLGGGLNSFREVEGTVVHNTPLWFLSDFGLAGLGVFTGFTVWFLVKGRRAAMLARGPEKPLATALVLGHAAMFGVALGIEAFYQRHWWMVMALIACSHSLATNNSGSLRDSTTEI